MKRILSVLGLAALAIAAGCLPSGPGATDAAKSTRSDALGGDDAVARAMEWVAAKVPYCAAPNHAYDGLICDTTCNRSGAAGNPAWDAYRADCSGLVSYAWGLAAPGQITTGLDAMTSPIPTSSLAPGDILLTNGHVVLFAGWTGAGTGAGTIIQEGDCDEVAETLPVSIPVGSAASFAMWGETYTAKRWSGLAPGSGGSPPPPAANDCDGVDYTGYCDGATLVWCDESGELQQKDCGANGAVCAYQDDATGYDCMAPAAPPPPSGGDPGSGGCGDVTEQGYCDGATLVWCQGDVVESYDCSADGLSCAWQDDAIGYNCL